MQNDRLERAKQFLPFDALKGFREALLEKEKQIENKKTLLDDKADILNQKLLKLKARTIIKVKYFSELEYIETTGKVVTIDKINKTLNVLNTKISFDNIIDIEILN